MATNIWRGGANAVSQVWQGTIGSTTVGHTFIVTITETDGAETAAITYTAITGDTTTTIATGFAAAWNASGNPYVARVTASTNSAVVILTADTAGRPFTVATSGTGTWSSTGNTTATSGPNDGGLAVNWSDGIPTASDVVWFPPGAPSLLYGLDLHTVTAGQITVISGYNGQIGRIENGKLYYFQLGCSGLTIRGGGSLYAFDVGSSAIAPLIECPSSSVSSYAVNQVHLTGSALTTVNAGGGNVGIGTFPGDTSTVTGGGTAFNGSTLQIGSGVTVTGTAWTVNGGGSTIINDVALPTLTMIASNGTIRANVTTFNAKNNANVILDGAITITTLNTYGENTLNAVVNGAAKTITTLNRYGPLTINDPAGKVTITTNNNYYTADTDYSTR